MQRVTIKQMKTLRLTLIFLAVMLVFPVISLAEEEASVNAARAERVEQTKATFPIRLSEKEKNTLALRCEKAQTNLSKIKIRLEARESIISKKYELIELHLAAIQELLIAKQLDTSIIDLLLSNFQKLTNEHYLSFANYQLSLADSTELDCAADPQAFKALIEDVRTKRQDFVSSINSIKDFSSTDLKTSFDALRTRLNSRSE